MYYIDVFSHLVQSYEYSRLNNSTRNTVERVVASLEGAKYGLAYASGMAAITTVVNLLSSGDHIVSSVDLYGGTSIYLKQVADRLNIKTTFVSDVTDPANIEKAILENTRVRSSLLSLCFYYSTTALYIKS